MKAGNYTIKWSYFKRYRKPLAGEPIKLSQELIYDGTDTICTIERNEVHHASGMAHCTPTDIFCKDKGRKLSLARAMKNALLSKEERIKVWNDYRNMTNKPRW